MSFFDVQNIECKIPPVGPGIRKIRKPQSPIIFPLTPIRLSLCLKHCIGIGINFRDSCALVFTPAIYQIKNRTSGITSREGGSFPAARNDEPRGKAENGLLTGCWWVTLLTGAMTEHVSSEIHAL